MSGILMMVIAIVVLGGAYLLYGRYLQNKWGIDPKAKTPAYELEDGVDSNDTYDGCYIYSIVNDHCETFQSIYSRRSQYWKYTSAYLCCFASGPWCDSSGTGHKETARKTGRKNNGCITLFYKVISKLLFENIEIFYIAGHMQSCNMSRFFFIMCFNGTNEFLMICYDSVHLMTTKT